ncbi:MAG: hypothetical protein Kow0067_01710 [Coriobacteriia bacterium]
MDQLREKALRIRDLADAEIRQVTEQRAAQVVAIGVVALLAAISLAYYVGTRRGRVPSA